MGSGDDGAGISPVPAERDVGVTAVAFIHVGDELLNGGIDPYPVEMIERMRRDGCSITCVTVVRDDVDDIVSAFRFVISLDPNVVIVTGGLGPTMDDVTREALAELMETELEIDEEAA